MIDEEELITPWDSHIEQYNPVQRKSTNLQRESACKLVALHKLDRLKTRTIDMYSSSKKTIYMPIAKVKKLTRFSESTEPTQPTLDRIPVFKKQQTVKCGVPSLLPELTLYRYKMMTRPFAMQSINYERRYSPKQNNAHMQCLSRNKKHNSIIQTYYTSNNKDINQKQTQAKQIPLKPKALHTQNSVNLDNLSQNQIMLLKRVQSNYKSSQVNRAIKLVTAVQRKQKGIGTGIKRYNLFRF